MMMNDVTRAQIRGKGTVEAAPRSAIYTERRAQASCTRFAAHPEMWDALVREARLATQLLPEHASAETMPVVP